MAGDGGFAAALRAVGLEPILVDGADITDVMVALESARTRLDVDTDRIVAWGAGEGGGQVLELGADYPWLAAVIAVTPAVERRLLPQRGPSVRCPLLVQLADFERDARSEPAMKAARRGRAEIRHLPCADADVLAGGPQHERAVAQQLDFLRRHALV